MLNSINLLKTIIDTLPIRVFWKSTELTYLGCNKAFAEDAGLNDPEEIIGKSDFELVWKDRAERYRSDDQKVIESEIAKLNFEEPLKIYDGQVLWIRTSKTPLYDEEGTLVGVLGMYEDITEVRESQMALLRSQKHLQTIIETEPECVKLVNSDGDLVSMNPAGLTMLQASSLDEAQTHPLIDYVKPEWRDAFINLHQKVMAGHSGTLEFEVIGLKNEERWLETHAVPMFDAQNNVTMLLGITRDITQRKRHEAHIQHLANTDSLTGLANRIKLEEQLKYVIALSKRNSWSFALMFVDIDHFKDINDTLGHTLGDKLLIAITQRFQSVIRDEDILARLGGDEFIFLIPNCDVNSAQLIAEKLLHTLQDSFAIEEHKLMISASIGISIYPDDGLNMDELLRHSDIAMYRAKSQGRNGYSFFTEQMQLSATRHLKISSAMHHALEMEEFYLLYQPQIQVSTGTIVGVEALLRWENPKLGSLSPDEFIPIAESNGLISKIGEWVLRTALRELKSWQALAMPPLQMAVNLSTLQFKDASLVSKIATILEEEEVSPHLLDLELTESAAMSNPEKAVAVINSLHEKGINFAIDDFGTGYSSLSYLKKLNIAKLKIDRSFINDITTDPDDKAIVSAIITMAKSLGIETIAEGVESKKQFEYLVEQGCGQIQGYYFDRPLTSEQLITLYGSD